jgi:cholesterol oxidase
MNRISSTLDLIQDSYDVVVIGSGYGGGISASRLARAGKKSLFT